MSFNFDFNFKNAFKGMKFFSFKGMTPVRFISAVAIFITFPLLMVSTNIGLEILKDHYVLVVIGNLISAFIGALIWCPNGLQDIKKKFVYEEINPETKKWEKVYNPFYGTLVIAILIAIVLSSLMYGYA